MKEKQIESNGIKYLLNRDGTACVTGLNKDFWKEDKVDCLTIPKEVEYEGARYGITKISHEAFRYSGLRLVAIPEGVTEVGHRAFFECDALLSVSIPASVAKIGNDVFRGCEHLQSVEVSSENKVYSSFEGVLYSKGREVLIECPAGKTSVNIPENVTKIGDDAFFECKGLSSITIPESVTRIGCNAFYGCRGLTSVVCLAKEPPAVGLFQGSICGTLRVPTGCCETYQQSDWSKYFEKIEEI